jgi:MscS family membrane protein
MDEIGRLPSHEPIRIFRLDDGPEVRWVFSNATVSRIDFWYAGLSDRWIRENAPEFLLRTGPRDMLWWQWIAAVALGGLSMLGGRLFAGPVGYFLRRIFSKTKTPWDNALLGRAKPPLALLLGVGLAFLLLPWLDLYEPGRVFMGSALRAIALIALFWALWRSVDVGVTALNASAWSQGASAKSLVSLGSALAKIGIAVLGVIAALSELGYAVSGLLAGLGIGGLALALAAQKTGENLFGSLSLALDRPFDVGEFVKVDDFVAHVENVGLRSTRFRTLDRTLITIPNGRVADMRIENYTMRDRLRLACTISLVHGTKAEQVKQVLGGIESRLRAQPKIWPDAVTVRLREFGPASLDIEVGAWFLTTDWPEFLSIRQDILLQIMEVVETAGTSLAFPTRTLLPAVDAATAPRPLDSSPR